MLTPDAALLSQRPQMPTPHDQRRSVHQMARLRLLVEDWDDDASDWNETRVDGTRLAQWGLPDTSSNLVADMSRQLSTPGLYGAHPSLGHAAPEAQLLVGPGGYMDRSGYWTMMQHVQYLTTGLCDMFVALDVVDGECAAEPVYPHDIQLIWHPRRPNQVVGLWRLRLRLLPAPFSTWIWAWDQYDLGEREEVDGLPVETRPPSFRVVGASGDWIDKPITNMVVAGAGEALVGETYRWRFEDGTAFIPYGRYVDVDTGGGWNWTHRRSAMRGAMNAMTLWTYAGAAARDASGRTVIAWGLVPMGANQSGAGTTEKIGHIQLKPGSMLYHEVQDGVQPNVQEVGPGANVDDLFGAAAAYESRQMLRWGIDMAGAEKTASDPTSGAAKFVSRQQKRETAEMVRPLYMASDLDVTRKFAALLRIAGRDVFPESGYSISHAPIGKSAEEKEADRKDIEWRQSQGFVSKQEAYRLAHPGTTPPDAQAALVRAKAEDAELDAAIQAELSERGIKSAPPVDDLEAGKMVAAGGYVRDAAESIIDVETCNQMLVQLAGLSPAAATAITDTIKPKKPAPVAESTPEPAAP